MSLYAGTSTGKVYRSVNGSNWTLLSTGLPGNPITALAIRLAEPTVIYAALSGAGVYYSDDGGVNWQVLDNTGLWLDVAGLAVDATQSPQTLYAATLGRGMHDFEIVPLTAPSILLESPAGPYPFEASSSEIDVVATGLSTTMMFWSTNRGHAGLATPGLGDTWTAFAVPLETGLNLITLTAVDASSNEASTSLTVNLADPEPEIFVDPLSLPFGTVPVGGVSACAECDGAERRDGRPDPGDDRAGRREPRPVQAGGEPGPLLRRTRSRRRRRARWGSSSSRRAPARRTPPCVIPSNDPVRASSR